MTKVTVDQQFQTNQYLIISRQDEDETIVTSRVVISDENTNVNKSISSDNDNSLEKNILDKIKN